MILIYIPLSRMLTLHRSIVVTAARQRKALSSHLNFKQYSSILLEDRSSIEPDDFLVRIKEKQLPKRTIGRLPAV